MHSLAKSQAWGCSAQRVWPTKTHVKKSGAHAFFFCSQLRMHVHVRRFDVCSEPRGRGVQLSVDTD